MSRERPIRFSPSGQGVPLGGAPGGFYYYFMIIGSLGDNFLWFYTSLGNFSLFWQMFVLIYLHGEISLLSLHPWIALKHIDQSKSGRNEKKRNRRNLQIIAKHFCKQSTLKPRIFDWKSCLHFIFTEISRHEIDANLPMSNAGNVNFSSNWCGIEIRQVRRIFQPSSI